MNKAIKRGLLLLFSLLLVFVMAACGDSQAVSTSNDSNDSNGSNDSTDSNDEQTDDSVDYPNKNITIVWSSGAGSGGDIFLRTLSTYLSDYFDVSVVVENRTGASGANAWNYIKNSETDGYTLLGTSATLISAPILADMGVTYKDFTHVAQMFVEPQFVYVSADSELNTIQDLINYELENPKELSWATATPGSKDNIPLEMIYNETGIEPNTVSFESGSEALTQVIGGHIDVALGEYSSLRGQLEAGKINILTVLTEERYDQLSEVPTMKESGWNVVANFSRGIMAPQGTPDEIVDIILEALQDSYENEEFKNIYEDQGLMPAFAAKGDFTEKLDELDEFVRKLFSE